MSHAWHAALVPANATATHRTGQPVSAVISGGYQIEAFITSVEQPLVGISIRVNMGVSYAMRRNGSVIWRKSIKSTYNAPLGEAFVGAVRVRESDGVSDPLEHRRIDQSAG